MTALFPYYQTYYRDYIDGKDPLTLEGQEVKDSEYDKLYAAYETQLRSACGLLGIPFQLFIEGPEESPDYHDDYEPADRRG